MRNLKTTEGMGKWVRDKVGRFAGKGGDIHRASKEKRLEKAASILAKKGGEIAGGGNIKLGARLAAKSGKLQGEVYALRQHSQMRIKRQSERKKMAEDRLKVLWLQTQNNPRLRSRVETHLNRMGASKVIDVTNVMSATASSIRRAA